MENRRGGEDRGMCKEEEDVQTDTPAAYGGWDANGDPHKPCHDQDDNDLLSPAKPSSLYRQSTAYSESQ